MWLLPVHEMSRSIDDHSEILMALAGNLWHLVDLVDLFINVVKHLEGYTVTEPMIEDVSAGPHLCHIIVLSQVLLMAVL